MKRLFAVGILAGLFVVMATGLLNSNAPAIQAPPVLAAYTPPPCRLFSTQHVALYAQRIYAGIGSVSSSQRAHLRWEESCLKYPNALLWIQRWVHSQYVKHLARASDPLNNSDLGDVPGVPRSFALCVAMKESTMGQGGSNIYGVTAGSGYGDMTGQPLSVQKATMSRVYHDLGPSAWTSWEPPPPCG